MDGVKGIHERDKPIEAGAIDLVSHDIEESSLWYFPNQSGLPTCAKWLFVTSNGRDFV